MGILKGPAHGAAASKRRKFELVEELAHLLARSKDRSLTSEDKELAGRVTAWVPRLDE